MSDLALTLIVSIPGAIIALGTFAYASVQFSKQGKTNGHIGTRIDDLERELRFYKDKAETEEAARRRCEGERATAERQVRLLTAENLELRRGTAGA